MARVLFMVMLFLNIRTCFNVNLGSENQPTASTMWQTVRATVTSLSDDAHGYLVSLCGKQAVDTSIKTVRNAVKVASEAMANALNVAGVYIAEVLAAAGIDAKLPVKRVTPEGVVFVTQWALLVVVGYWILSLAVSLVAGVVRSTLWLFKITFAVAMFGLILSDTGASAETTAMRLGVLVFACVLFGIGPSSFRFRKDATTNIEAKVKVLESRLREMEKRRKNE
ncbi:voltage-gated monoatomic cation channel TMEM109 [Brachyhypopomus gauderio]|uniref:voltage-gated monoatomic cation channel TMEM109 n=1 Tax=Brachyhypopomus gauderio TaxID=698409 RepID=UPI004042CF8E